MKLSIIVPVYGVEKYILEFAESLLFQLNDEVELIIINDGTKDKSIDVLKEYVQKNDFQKKKIIWLEQENQGQSVARNYGISIAKGEYVTFLDPDDFVIEKYVPQILENLDLYADIDLYQYNAYIFKDNKVVDTLRLAENNDCTVLDLNI
ncbi:glycosyltransferase, partial [Acinetobacter sp. GC2]|uniref:glycosyltransferase n=1 Tax=Acinetobacter lwoffii TaxID=28090 RepID=UPI0013DF6473